jgi:hypothetical protein
MTVTIVIIFSFIVLKYFKSKLLIPVDTEKMYPMTVTILTIFLFLFGLYILSMSSPPEESALTPKPKIVKKEKKNYPKNFLRKNKSRLKIQMVF